MANQTDSKVPAIRLTGFSEKWEEKPIGKVLSETKRPIVLEDKQQYELVTVKRRNGGVVSRGHLWGREILVKNYSQLQTGDFLISKRQVVHGATGIVPAELNNAIVSNEYLVVVGNKEITTEFLTILASLPDMRKKFFLSSYGVDIEKLFFDAEDWKKRNVTIPKLPEQTQIGEYFRELDSLIGLHQRKHDKLVTLKKAMLQKMFPHPGATTPEIRFKGFEGDWVEKTLAGISEIKTGPFGSTLHAKDYVSDGVPIITTEHFKFWCLPETKKGLPQVSTSDYKRLKSYVLKHGDIVFSRVGSIDINAHVEEKQNGWLFSGRVLRVRTPPSIDSEYLHHELSTDRARKCVAERAVGQTMPSINTGILGGTVVFLPEQKTEQQKIGTYFRTLDALIFKHATQLQKLQQIKSACLEKMFV